jgi:hypothetical protein
MVIIKLQGGLGNQMFQYAFGISLAKTKKQKLYFDLSFLEHPVLDNLYTKRNYELNIFKNIKVKSVSTILLFLSRNTITRKIANKLGFKVLSNYQEQNFSFDEKIAKEIIPYYYDGYWQSYKYFNNHIDLIKDSFFFTENVLNIYNLSILHNIRVNESCSIHIRRTDYLSKNAFNYHGTCNLDYYQKAVDFICSKIKSIQFFIFSDDYIWAKENIKVIVENSFLIEGNHNENSWIDMFLMSQCSHNIIANSSFSWWGAWLNENPNKIIMAPQVWFAEKSINTSDLIPKEWVLL